jgi:hypothetical protein
MRIQIAGLGGLPRVLVLMLLVSWSSLILQSAALVHLLRQRGATAAVQLTGHGYARTAACRVVAASIYSTVALLAVLGIRIPGAGQLGPEAVFIFTLVQAIWLSNSALDIRLRHRLQSQDSKPG